MSDKYLTLIEQDKAPPAPQRGRRVLYVDILGVLREEDHQGRIVAIGSGLGNTSGTTVKVGTTTTGTAGSDASVTNSGTATAVVLDFTIPQGAAGETGETGQGVIVGGTTGQVLAKASDDDYDMEWATISGGVTDGDKGEIVVSGGGTVWEIENGVVTTAKMGGDVTVAGISMIAAANAAAQRALLSLGSLAQLTTINSSALLDNSIVTFSKIQNVSATDRVLGRSTAGAGVIEEITCTAAGRALISGADNTAQRSTLGLGALAVLSTIGTSQLIDGNVTFAKMQALNTQRVMGRNTAGDGAPEMVTFSQFMDWVGSSAQGDILYRNAAGWTRLGAGTSGMFLKTLGAGANPTWDTASGSVADGDKGDIVVTASGATWTIDTGVVTTTKMGGDVTTAGKALLTAADASAQRTALVLGSLATLSTIVTANITDANVTYAKIQNVTATDRLLGRSTSGAGVIEEVTCTAFGRSLIDDADAAAGRVTLDTHRGVFNAAVTTQAVSGAAVTYVAGSALSVGGKLKAGACFSWTITATKTNAGVATPVFNIHFGTNGTTADTVRCTVTGVAQTGAVDTAIIRIVATVRTYSASGIVQMGLEMHHFQTTTGFATKAQVQIIENTSGTFDLTGATLIAGIGINPGSLGVWTVTQCQAEAKNLS